MSAREEAAFKVAKDYNLGLRRTGTGWVAVESVQGHAVGAEATDPVEALENGRKAIEANVARKANDAAARLQGALSHGRFYPQPTDRAEGDVAWSVRSRKGEEVQGGLASWLEAARLIAELDAAEVAKERGQAPSRPLGPQGG